LANIYRERRASQEMIGLVKGYVTENNFDPEIYIHQPFASAVPRWIHQAIGRRSESNIEKLLVLIEEMDELETLSRRVEEWRREFPENFSLSIFEVYLAARKEDPDWKEKFIQLERRYEKESGSLKSAWSRSEALFTE